MKIIRDKSIINRNLQPAELIHGHKTIATKLTVEQPLRFQKRKQRSQDI
jgi:hypothetical protein